MQNFEVDLEAFSPSIQRVVGNHLLRERPARAPDYRAEVDATTAVVRALLDTPDSVLVKLAQAVKALTGADSAGISLAGRQDGRRILTWQAAVGLVEKYRGTVLPHDDTPCGPVVDTNQTMLMVDPGLAFSAAAQVQPPIREVLLVPFHLEGCTVGTVWVISQSDKQFDAEDARLLNNLSELAALAYQTLTRIGDLELLTRTVQGVADKEMGLPGFRSAGERQVT